MNRTTNSERYVLEVWLQEVCIARLLGFTRRQAHELASLKMRVWSGATTEYPEG